MLNLAQANDDKIWEHAKKDGYTIVTKDSDFNDISMVKGFPPHIIWLRIGNSRLNVTGNRDNSAYYLGFTICDCGMKNKEGGNYRQEARGKRQERIRISNNEQGISNYEIEGFRD
jgi:hypothetical protein